jgi:hypothetical protein
LLSNIFVEELEEETDTSLKKLALSGNGMLVSYRMINEQTGKIGLNGLSNIDPDSAKALTIVMATVPGPHGFWATQSKYDVIKDVRLIEMSKNSVILRLLAQKGETELPVQTAFEFEWSHAPTIKIDLPSKVYWYKKDIPELRDLLNSKYEVYQNAAAKVLDEINQKGTEDEGLEAGKKPAPERTSALRKMMADGDWTLRYRALEALRVSGADAADLMPEVLKLFNDNTWYVHNSAALIIENEKSQYIDYLKDVIKTGSLYYVRERAKDILGRIDEK